MVLVELAVGECEVVTVYVFDCPVFRVAVPLVQLCPLDTHLGFLLVVFISGEDQIPSHHSCVAFSPFRHRNIEGRPRLEVAAMQFEHV